MNTKTINATFSMSYMMGEGVELRIKDKTSGIEFVEIRLSNEEFTLALSTLQERPAIHCEVRDLQHVGKIRETQQVKMYYDQPLPDKWENAKAASKALKDEAKAQGLDDGGWSISTYPALNSQGGAGEDGKGQWYKLTLTRFVDAEEQPGEAE